MGSIGERHARLLHALGLEVAAVSRRADVPVRRYATLAEAVERANPGYVVIANETTAHRPTLAALAALDFRGAVLVEKPLFERPAPLPENRFKSLSVGYNLRFHPVLRELQRALADEPALSANAHVGQYLPEWRPGRDYRATASAARAAGGGALRDLSHELDYLSWLFGRCRRVAALGGRFGPLEIDSDDLQSLLLAFERCPVASAQLSYLERDAAREVAVTTAQRTFRADLIKGTLSIGDEERRFVVDRDETYRAQHAAVLAGRTHELCSADEGAAVVALIAAAETAAASEAWVSLISRSEMGTSTRSPRRHGRELSRE